MKDRPDRGGPDRRGARAQSATRRHCFGSYSHGPTRWTSDDFEFSVKLYRQFTYLMSFAAAAGGAEVDIGDSIDGLA